MARSRTLPDEKSNTEPDLDLETQRYIAAATEVIADDAPLAAWLGPGHADLAHESQHVSYAVQDFTSVTGTLGQGLGFASIQNTMDKIQGDGQDNFDRQQTAKRQRERVEKRLEPRTDSDQAQNIQDADASVHVQVREVDAQAAEVNAGGDGRNAKNPESGQALGQAQPNRADPHPIESEILNQQDRILQMSQNTSVNQVKAQAHIAKLSARVEQLSAQQRQLQGNWRRQSMEGQNRTQQNMGGN